MSEGNTVIIRKANKDDMVHVYKLIKELAKFENMEDQVKISVETLEQDGFNSANPIFSCLVADIDNGEIAGYAIYFTSYSTWLGKSIFLEDLYVQPMHRNKSIGKQLFLAVAKIAYIAPSKRLDFHVLSWNPATDFYSRLGAEDFTVSEKWHLYRLNEQCLDKLLS